MDRDLFDFKVLFLKYSDVISYFEKENIAVEVLSNFFYKNFYLYFFHSEAGNIKLYDLRRILKVIISFPLSAFYFAQNRLKKENYDLIYLNSSFLLDWVIAAKLIKKKVICHIQEPIASGYFGLRKYFVKKILEKYADKIIFISKDNEQRLGISQKSIVVYNSVDEIFLDNLSTPVKKDDSYNIIYVGGYSLIKGFHILAESLDLIKNNIKVFFIGYYPTYDNRYINIRKRIKLLYGENKKLKIALKKMRDHSNAIEIGITANVYEYLKKSSLLVFPSTVPHFARPVMEAMFFRMPVLASNVKGMDEIVFDRINGKLVVPGNPKALADEINKFASGFYDSSIMGENGYKFAIKNFLPDNNNIVIQEIIELINN